ncbi:MAG: hypothetical protein AABO41_06535 [Acidobacteriota bacterium]
MKEIKLAVLLAVALALVSAGGCARAPAGGGSVPAQSNNNAGQTNAQDLTATPLYAKTVRGDIERAGLAISMARDFVKQEQWSEAVVQLRAAQTQIDEALRRKPRLKEQFEELKSALGQAIQTAENRSKDVEAQFAELQTRVNALKVYTDQ